MKRLYNKYLADDLNITKPYHDMLNDYSSKIVAFALENDFDLRDAKEIAMGFIECEFAEAILRRALAMRREERKNEQKII